MAVTDQVRLLAEQMHQGLGGASLTDLDLAQMRALVEQIASAPPEVTVHSVEDRIVDGPDVTIPIRIYRPDDAPDLPALVWLHGGGFALGSLETGDDICRRLCSAAGIVVINVDYRLSPEHPYPAALDDCMAVYAWARAEKRAGDGIDGARVAVAGDSAGGNLAMAMSLRCRDESLPLPSCQVSIYGTAEMVISNPELGDLPFLANEDVEWFWSAYLPEPECADHPYVSPARASVLSDLSPLLVVTAEHDPTRDASEDYARRVLEAGVEVEIRRYPLMYHGFFGRPGMFAEAAQAHRDVVEFLSRHLELD